MRWPLRGGCEFLFEIRIVLVTGGDGFLVVPAREFERRGFLIEIHNSKIVVSAPITRLYLDGLSQRSLGRATHPLFAQGQAKIVLQLRILRVELGAAAKAIQRIIVFALAELDEAEDINAVSIVWIVGEGFFNVFLSGIEVLSFNLDR